MKALTLLAMILLSGLGFSQDYHNWSEHYGAKASLLGGAATAGLGDNSTVYYNAAAMGFADETSASITVNAYKYSYTQLENALGEGHNLKASSFSTMPNMIAGVLKFKKFPKIRVGYAALTSRMYSGKFDYLHSDQMDIFSSHAGDETFVGSYTWNHSLSEYWGGIAFSWTPVKWFSAGFSHFGIYRDMKYQNTVDLTVLPQLDTVGEASSVSSNISFNYWNVKINFKPTVAFNWEVVKLGIAYTTPTINIMGRANVYRDFNVINMSEIIAFDVSLIDRAEKIKAVHKSNGALAIGLSWKMGDKLWGHFSHETFFKQEFFYVFDPQQIPNSYPVTLTQEEQEDLFGGEGFMGYGEETVAMTNFGVGLEAKLNDKWGMYSGLRTDFLNNAKPYYLFAGLNTDATKWNLYHASFGLVHQHKSGKQYTAGLEFAITPKQRYYHLYDFNSPRNDNALLGDGSANAFANFYSVKILVEIKLIKKDKESESPDPKDL